MYRTPRFFTFIDEISLVLCLNEEKTRKRALSESRSFDSKQIYFSDFLSQLSKVLNYEKSEINYLTEVFFKVENILSDLAKTPIYSNVHSESIKRFFILNTLLFLLFYWLETYLLNSKIHF